MTAFLRYFRSFFNSSRRCFQPFFLNDSFDYKHEVAPLDSAGQFVFA